ncbi:MAG: PrgI family protein [Christensenella sp.]|uniref:PrgI family protein n=1 Tax=Christensenella sp. TaxID=1935934 RepID=UPI002B1F09DF|nr:PrgI family protein [Christensenella sp.]MEA5003791.1 PrgI family protein [Christensenella sp.]
MPYVNVPKDLTKVKTKIALGLTKRQLICFSSAAAVGIPIYFLTKAIVGGTVGLLLMIGVMLPFFFLAMYERDGQPAERILKYILRHRLWPAARPYRTENLYLYLEKEGKSLANKNITKHPCREKASRAATASARQRKTGKDK